MHDLGAPEVQARGRPGMGAVHTRGEVGFAMACGCAVTRAGDGTIRIILREVRDDVLSLVLSLVSSLVAIRSQPILTAP